jgi:hypothetical protein
MLVLWIYHKSQDYTVSYTTEYDPDICNAGDKHVICTIALGTYRLQVACSSRWQLLCWVSVLVWEEGLPVVVRKASPSVWGALERSHDLRLNWHRQQRPSHPLVPRVAGSAHCNPLVNTLLPCLMIRFCLYSMNQETILWGRRQKLSQLNQLHILYSGTPYISHVRGFLHNSVLA